MHRHFCVSRSCPPQSSLKYRTVTIPLTYQFINNFAPTLPKVKRWQKIFHRGCEELVECLSTQVTSKSHPRVIGMQRACCPAALWGTFGTHWTQHFFDGLSLNDFFIAVLLSYLLHVPRKTSGCGTQCPTGSCFGSPCPTWPAMASTSWETAEASSQVTGCAWWHTPARWRQKDQEF